MDDRPERGTQADGDVDMTTPPSQSSERAAEAVYVSGASDDLIEIEGSCSGCDEYPGHDEHFVLTGTGGRSVRVRVWYTRRGLWAIAVAPVDEGLPMLPVALDGAENGYSARLMVPDVLNIVHEVSP